MILLAFAAGCAIALPVPLIIFPCLCIGGLLWQYPVRPTFILCTIGMCVTLCHQWLYAPTALPNQTTLYKANLIGEIIHLPRYKENKLSFDMSVQQLNGQSVSFIVRLSCYQQCPKVTAGDYISLQATLRRPRGYLNPGSFLFQQWAWSNHIDRIGSFYPQSLLIIGKRHKISIDKLRTYLYQGIQKLDLNKDARR